MKKHKSLLAIILCLFLLSGCMYTEKTRTTEIQYVIGVSLANLSEQWRLVLKNELEEEADKYDSVRLVILDAAGDDEKQIADVERLMGLGVDLLIISPEDVATLTPVISDVYAKIPVIVLDRVVEGYDYSLFIGPDNGLIGRQAGETILELLEDEQIVDGSVLEMKNDSFASESRSEDFIMTLSKAGVKTSSVFVKEATRDCAEDILLATPELLEGVDVIFAHNDYMAYGAHLALEKLNLSGIKIVGLDGFSGQNGGLQMVENGIIDATVTCPTGGSEAIRYAIDIINKVSGIPKQIILRSHKISKDNVLTFKEDSENTPQKQQENVRVGYVQILEESNWRQASIDSLQKAAKEFDVNLTIAYNNQSVEEQMDQVRDFIEEDMDIIVLSPIVSEGWEDILKQAKEARIPVLLVDRMVAVGEELYASFIGGDFAEEGRRCARWLMEETQDAEQVRILELRGTDGASPAINREEGFGEVISSDKRYQIVHSECGDFTREGGEMAVRNYISKKEWDIDAIYAHNDEMALGAASVLKEYGIDPGTDVKIMSVDGTYDALTALKKGQLNCVAECTPLLGPQIMKAIMDLSQGKELPLRIIADESVFTNETPKELFENRKY